MRSGKTLSDPEVTRRDESDVQGQRADVRSASPDDRFLSGRLDHGRSLYWLALPMACFPLISVVPIVLWRSPVFPLLGLCGVSVYGGWGGGRGGGGRRLQLTGVSRGLRLKPLK